MPTPRARSAVLLAERHIEPVGLARRLELALALALLYKIVF